MGERGITGLTGRNRPMAGAKLFWYACFVGFIGLFVAIGFGIYFTCCLAIKKWLSPMGMRSSANVLLPFQK